MDVRTKTAYNYSCECTLRAQRKYYMYTLFVQIELGVCVSGMYVVYHCCYFFLFFSQKLEKRRSARTSLLNKYKTTDERKYKFVVAEEMNLADMSSEESDFDEDGNV